MNTEFPADWHHRKSLAVEEYIWCLRNVFNMSKCEETLWELNVSWIVSALLCCIEINRTFSWTLTVAWRFKGSESLFPNVKAVELFYLCSYSLSVWRLLDFYLYLRWPPNTTAVSSSDRLLRLLNYSFVLFARLGVRDWKFDKDGMIEDSMR